MDPTGGNRARRFRRARSSRASVGRVVEPGSDAGTAAGGAETGEHAPGYPAHWEADVVLRDGRPCHVRPVTADDGPALHEFNEGLSEDTLHLRYFSANPELSERDAERMTSADYRDRVALLAEVRGRIIGVGIYNRVEPDAAEIAFTIGDDDQGRGLGSILLEHLAAIAREIGLHRFTAEVLPSNKRMLATFERAGYQPTQSLEEGVVRLEFGIDPTPQSRAVAQGRERRAEALSVAALLSAASVAVICDDLADSAVLLGNLRRAGYTGDLVAVHPSARDDAALEVAGVRCVAELAGAGFDVELAVVEVAAAALADVITSCAQAGVRGVVITSGGFGSGEDSMVRQHELVRAARGGGVRIVGPGAIGLINTDPRVRLNASWIAQLPGRGRTGLYCQTGAMGEAILEGAKQRGLGMSSFVAAGDRADVSADDLLQYWASDDATALIALYLETVGNPRKFTRIARHAATVKPVIAMRPARTARSIPVGGAVRTSRLPARAIDAMFDQAGVIQTDTLAELFDVAVLLAFQPLPRGSAVAIVCDSAELGRLIADNCAAAGLSVIGSPTLIECGAGEDGAESAIVTAAADPAVDAIVVGRSSRIGSTDEDPVRAGILAAAAAATKPTLAIMLAAQPVPLAASMGPHGLPGHGSVPVYSDVESAVRALRRIARYAQWHATPPGEPMPRPDVQPEQARQLVRARLERIGVNDPASEHRDDQPILGQEELATLLAAYGIELWPLRAATSEEDAVAAALELGMPAVMKTSAIGLAHRADLGGTRLSLENEAAVRTAYLSMVATLAPDALSQLVVQRMAPPGVPCTLQTVEDPLFGPVVSFAIGGTISELLGDAAYRIPPLTDRDVADLVRAPAASSLLFGYGGSELVDVDALQDLIARLGQLADDLPEVAHLALNPVIVHAKGVAVLGARARLHRPEARTDLEARRLLG